MRVVALSVVVLLLTGCSAGQDSPDTASASVTATAAPSATDTPAPTPTAPPTPVLVPGGTATDNLPYFRQVVQTVWAGPGSVTGLAYIDALTAAGFDRASMQLTSDTTTIGQPAESIQFSVAWRDGCLVGQVGPATGDPVVAVLPLLAEGGCLVGQTVSADG